MTAEQTQKDPSAKTSGTHDLHWGQYVTGAGVDGVVEQLPQEHPAQNRSGVLRSPRDFFPLSDAVLKAREELDPLQAVDTMNRSFRQISRQIIGRQDVLEQTRLALLTRSHQLLDGPPGTGKSQLASTIFAQFSDQFTFPVQLHPDTTPEQLFGAIDIQQLKMGKVFHNTTNSLVEANFAYLDELFRANRGVLQTLLGVTHERWFLRGQQAEPSPLHSAIATTNFQRRSPELEALLDRFPFRARMEKITDPLLQARIDRSFQRGGGRALTPDKNEQIPMWQLEYLSDIVEGGVEEHPIEIPQYVLFLKNLLVQEFLNEVNDQQQGDFEETISNRTTASAQKLLRASALVRGSQDVCGNDLMELRHVLVPAGVDGPERAAFDRALLKVRKDINQRDEVNIDTLLRLDLLSEQVIDAFEQRGQALSPVEGHLEPLEPTMIEQVKKFFRLTSMKDLSFARMKTATSSVRAESPTVQALQTQILEELEKSRRLLNRADNAPLL